MYCASAVDTDVLVEILGLAGLEGAIRVGRVDLDVHAVAELIVDSRIEGTGSGSRGFPAVRPDDVDAERIAV